MNGTEFELKVLDLIKAGEINAVEASYICSKYQGATYQMTYDEILLVCLDNSKTIIIPNNFFYLDYYKNKYPSWFTSNPSVTHSTVKSPDIMAEYHDWDPPTTLSCNKCVFSCCGGSGHIRWDGTSTQWKCTDCGSVKSNDPNYYWAPSKAYKPSSFPSWCETPKKCECGGATAKTTHAHWCPVKN